VNGGRTPKRPRRVGGVGCNGATGRRRSEGGRGVPNQVEVRWREDRNEIMTFRRCRPYRTGIQGDTAIPGSRATVATASTIIRYCDRPIDQRKGLPTLQTAKRGSEARAEKGGSRAKRPLETRTPGPKDMIREVRREGKGSAHGECGCSLQRV